MSFRDNRTDLTLEELEKQGGYKLTILVHSLSAEGNMRCCLKDDNVISSKILITRYAKIGRTDDPHQFDNMNEQVIVLWIVMLTWICAK